MNSPDLSRLLWDGITPCAPFLCFQPYVGIVLFISSTYDTCLALPTTTTTTTPTMSTSTKRGLADTTNALVPTLAGEEAAPPPKKPRKKPVTAKSLGLTKEEFESIKAAPVKKKLKEHVKTLARQVDVDWHDGWEEQSETKVTWFSAIQEPLQAVLDIGVGKETALIPNSVQ